MAQKRDGRTKKDDVLIPLNVLPVIETIRESNGSDEALNFIISIIEMGEAACEAGFKKDGDELQESIAAAIDESKQKITNGENPLIAFVVGTVSNKIEMQTNDYYKKINEHAKKEHRRSIWGQEAEMKTVEENTNSTPPAMMLYTKECDQLLSGEYYTDEEVGKIMKAAWAVFTERMTEEEAQALFDTRDMSMAFNNVMQSVESGIAAYNKKANVRR